MNESEVIFRKIVRVIVAIMIIAFIIIISLAIYNGVKQEVEKGVDLIKNKLDPEPFSFIDYSEDSGILITDNYIVSFKSFGYVNNDNTSVHMKVTRNQGEWFVDSVEDAKGVIEHLAKEIQLKGKNHD